MRIAARVLTAAILASVFAFASQSQLVDAFVLNGWRWCDRWADIRPASSYALETYPVGNAAFTWSQVDGSIPQYKVDFDFYLYASPGSAKIQLYSDNYPGLNGTVADASWSGFPWCFGSGSILFNTSYWFYPPTTACQWPNGYYNLETVALHELGHLAGLGHSAYSGAVMYASLPNCFFKGLDGDDHWGITEIYGTRLR